MTQTPAADIVERLMAHMGKANMQDVLPDCREAATEIEALRAREAELQRKLDEVVDRAIEIARETIIAARMGDIDSDLRSISHILEGRLASIRGETDR